MKTCPSCGKTYEDQSMVFCLDDGARLEPVGAAFDSNATWNLPPPGPTVASPRPTSPTAQSTLTSRPGQFQRQVSTDDTRTESRRGALPWVFAIVLVLGASGVLMAWLMTRGGDSDVSGKYPAPTPVLSIVPSPSPMATLETKSSATPNERPSAAPVRAPVPPPESTPVIERPKAMFTTLNNTSLNGTRITYYQRASFALCKADCAGNANCKGLAWIRPGAYNSSDPGMCYLLSAVTQ
ncbi:MAG TPA: hypothetical protein VN956_13555, partial [Pyrinomonadaceae bacterium]|nr:hypothetical protein [Pyrinomonadaceae bacterium]